MKLALAVTVLWPLAAGGGFSGQVQYEFIALAGCLLLVTALERGARSLAALLRPLPATLLAAGALSAASALWTTDGPATAVRQGLLCAAYAAVAAAATLAWTDGGARALGFGLAGLAAAEALLGLVATATHLLPYAELLGTVWRPGGTFEYQPALALLEAGALPALAQLSASRERWARGAGTAGAALAGATLALAGDRLAVVLVLFVLLVLLAAWRDSARRLAALATLTVSAAVGAGAGHLLLGRPVAPGALGPGPLAATMVVALATAAGVGVAALTPPAPARRASRGLWIAAAVLLTACTAAVIAVFALGASGAHTAGFLHGRLQEWRAALQTWWQRPLLGYGAGSYYTASLPHQSVAISRFAHNLALQWAAELGIPGLLVVLALYMVSLRTAFHARFDRRALPLIAFALAFLVSNLVDWTWYIPGLTALWVATLGACADAPTGGGETPRISLQ